jgi:hypothetical protein
MMDDWTKDWRILQVKGIAIETVDGFSMIPVTRKKFSRKPKGGNERG